MKPQFKPEEIYLDLSKLSEEQQRKVIALLPKPINKGYYDIIYLHFYLIYDDEDCMWWVSTKYFLAEKTEINYSQFLDMMGEREEVLQVENKPFDREFILCASLKFHDNIVSGHRHSDCYELIRKMCPNIADTSLPQREDQGFLTSLNRHVDRKEGWKIAKENNQIKWGLNASDDNEESQLISENLY
jgi:hypothetical protein